MVNKREIFTIKTKAKGPALFKRVALRLCLCASLFAHLVEVAHAEDAPPKENSRRTTNFEWDPIPGAQSYEIEITPAGYTAKDAFRFTVEEPKWDGELKPGNYKMRLRSKDRRGVPGEWSGAEEFYVKLYAPKPLFPQDGQEVKSNEASTYDLVLKWEPQSEASRYTIHIEDETKTFSQDLEVKGYEIALKVPVARKYRWSIIGFDKQNTEGEKLSSDLTFTLLGQKLITPKIVTPETIFVRKLQWEVSPQSEIYKYTLQRKEKNRKWSNFQENQTTANEIPFDMKWPGGSYKLTVSAEGNLRQKSNAHSIIFSVANGARTEAAEKRALMRKSIDRVVDWYFIASYLITQIDYVANSFDNGSLNTFKVLGGTGRLGLGYLNPKQAFGFLGVADLSGFFIGEKNYTYPSLELHGIYRRKMGDLGELRLSTGIYNKVLPEIVSNPLTLQYRLEELSINGLHLGGEYWHSMNQKLGLQVNARMYLPSAGTTPNGGALASVPSMQVGVLGSLKLNTYATGLMGYVYRQDKIKYATTDPVVKQAGYLENETSITGHYLNFYLEWDL